MSVNVQARNTLTSGFGIQHTSKQVRWPRQELRTPVKTDVRTKTVLNCPKKLVGVACKHQAFLLLPALLLPPKPQHVNLALSPPAAGMTRFGAATFAVLDSSALLVCGDTAVGGVGPVEPCAGSISEAAGMLWPAIARQHF